MHIKEDVLDVVSTILDYCKKLLNDSQTYVENYYKNNNCNYVEHRIYNPQTYMFFENEEDYKQLKNAKNHYHFIEVDANNIFPQYQIMLVCDGSEADNDEDKRIEMFNSVYPIIMLKDCNNEIVGILKPEDNETYKLRDEHNLIYRKYRSITSDYRQDMFNAICSGEFHYYPYLSNATFCYDKSNSTTQE